MYTIRSVSSDGEYYLVNGWRKKKTFWTKKVGDALFKTEASAKASLTKLLKVMTDYLPDQFFIIELESPNAPYSEWKITEYVPTVGHLDNGAKFVAEIYGEILYGNSIASIKRKASKIANKKQNAVDTMSVYAVKNACRVVYHRFNEKTPTNNEIKFAEWR